MVFVGTVAGLAKKGFHPRLSPIWCDISSNTKKVKKDVNQPTVFENLKLF